MSIDDSIWSIEPASYIPEPSACGVLAPVPMDLRAADTNCSPPWWIRHWHRLVTPEVVAGPTPTVMLVSFREVPGRCREHTPLSGEHDPSGGQTKAWAVPDIQMVADEQLTSDGFDQGTKNGQWDPRPGGRHAQARLDN